MSQSVSKPIVSIIVPTRNRSKVLECALQGIYSQHFEDYEALIMDDGSEGATTESYTEILSGFDQRFKVHLRSGSSPTGCGPSTIRNAGIQIAQGKYIAFCDDDDEWIDTEYLVQAIRALESTGSDLFFGNQKTVKNGEVVNTDWLPQATRAAGLTQNEEASPGVYLLKRNDILQRPGYAHLNFTIVRKQLLDDIDGFWESVNFAEDVDLFVRLADRCEKILYRPKVNAVHNAPDNSFKNTASTRVSILNQRLIEALVYQHLLANCKSKDTINYIKTGAANNEKSIVEHLVNENKLEAASISAWRTLSNRFTFKWFIYTVWITFRSKLFG